jgi:hypothetical protein
MKRKKDSPAVETAVEAAVADSETKQEAAPVPARHTPDAGVKEYGISLDEISRRSRATRR